MTRLVRLRLFRTFRLWKSFKVWRRNITNRKTSHCREVLGEQLFILNPVFRSVGAGCREKGAWGEEKKTGN